jgi:GH18 family chitinase
MTVGQTGFGTVTFSVASSVPAGTKAGWTATIYTDAGYTQQVGNQTGGVINANVIKNNLKLGAYIDLYQYRNTGGVWPVGLYPGLNPTMRATNVNTILPSLDVFYMFSESQLYSDGNLYFGTNVGNPAALVLNSAGTGWANNTGSVSGGYVDGSNPDYTYSAYALKNSMYFLAQQTAWASNNTFMCIGGYLLSNYMDQAGANSTLATAAGSQVATLMNITGCMGVDLDYEPVGQNCNPTNMALLCQKISAAVKAISSTREVHLTLVPALSTADSQLRIATAVACYPYVDQINVMTYDDPNNLYEPNYQPGNVPVYSHTGVARSIQSVQWFINAGVPANKLGMGFACYGRNSASEGAAFTNTGSPYDQIVRSADAAGQSGNTFPYGTWSGSSPVNNPAPNSQSDYYYNPTQAVWAFDSCQTVTDKVEAAYNLGIRSVFTWQISGDYANEGSLLPAGNARANFALIKTARSVINSL